MSISQLRAQDYNPDILNTLANLSNDEVFTPPEVANQVLDLLPQELFRDPGTTFLDPATKSGVFLREIARHLMTGLADAIPDEQERRDHIFHHQLYGIAITELTSLMSRRSLYCSKFPNGRYSVSRFDTPEGNIRFKQMEHRFVDGRCAYCGASEKQFGKEVRKGLEFHAYEFIHTLKPEEVLDMKFDVIIGNPPYQLSDGGNQASATPIYQLFIEQAQKLKPRFLSMIVPSRWFSGGKGLDSFRSNMISDRRIRVLHDYWNASDCFGTSVEIKGGICYFLWDRDNQGDCHVISHSTNGKISEMRRYLKIEENSDIFVRSNDAISVLEKVRLFNEESFSRLISSRRPFGLPTNIVGLKSHLKDSIVIHLRGGTAYYPLSKIEKNKEWVSKHKIYITKAYNAGDDYPHQIINKPIYGAPNTCCSETYLLIGPFETKIEACNVLSYIRTRFFRFLVWQRKITQDATQKVYSFVPLQDFSKPWTDAELYAKYGLTEEEIAFIESMIRPMGDDGDSDA